MIPSTLFSEEAEKGTLASMLLNSALIPETLADLSPECFTSDRHRRFFLAIEAAFVAGKPVDLVSVMTAMREDGTSQPDDPGYLAGLTSFPIIPSVDHCRTVAELARKRVFLKELGQATASVLAGCSLNKVIEDFSPAIQRTTEKQARGLMLSATIEADLQRILQRYEFGGRLPGLSTGFEDVDRLTSGLSSSHLVILAARPAMGKSTLALNIAEDVASDGVPVAFFSLEMSRSELTEKLIAKKSSVPLLRIRDGSYSSKEKAKIEQAAKDLKAIPLLLQDQPGLSVHQLTAAVKGLHMRHGLGLIVVDYLQLMRGEDDKNREQEVASISRGLKCLAMELQVPVLALSQLNRALESRPDKKPTLADLRDSGSIEQDANQVWFIYRDEVYNKSESCPERGIAEIIVAKNRSGPTGMVKLGTSRLSYSEFNNISNR